MTEFFDRWHLGLGLQGAIVGALTAVVFRTWRPRHPEVLCAAAAIAMTMMAVEDLLPSRWWLWFLPFLLASRRPPDSAGADVDRGVSAVVLVSMAGLWATVPDTEGPLIVAMVLGPSLIWTVVRPTPIRGVGTAAALIAFVAAAVGGASGSAPAVLGSVCCGWWVVLAGFGAPRLAAVRRARPVIAVALVAEVVSAVVGSRVVGHASTGPAILATVVVVIASSAIAGGLVVRSTGLERSARSARGPDDE